MVEGGPGFGGPAKGVAALQGAATGPPVSPRELAAPRSPGRVATTLGEPEGTTKCAANGAPPWPRDPADAFAGWLTPPRARTRNRIPVTMEVNTSTVDLDTPVEEPCTQLKRAPRALGARWRSWQRTLVGHAFEGRGGSRACAGRGIFQSPKGRERCELGSRGETGRPAGPYRSER